MFLKLFYFIDSFASGQPMTNSPLSLCLILFVGGGAYTLGRQNSGNCWHLFTIDNYTDGLKVPDQTLEVSLGKQSKGLVEQG